MSESGDSGPGLREVAYRLFAAEFDDAEFSYSESDEERAPNYVVTPTGARVNRLFVVGVLTELEQVNEEVLRARVVDPTGPFVIYAGQYQPEALAFLEAATPPLFVAVTGKARTFEPDDSDRVFTSIRPESISEVDAETRDRWVVQAAEQTLGRVGRMAGAKQSGLSGDALRRALTEAGVEESDADGITLALDYYDTTGDYLQAVRDLSLNATRVVAGERDEAGTLSRSPGEGTDDPLGELATLELEAPAETPADEAGESGSADADDGDSVAADESEPVDTDDSDPVDAASTETTVAAETEPASETETTSSAEETSTDEPTGSSEPDTAAEPDTETKVDVEPTKETEPETATTTTGGGEEATSDTTTEPETEPKPDADITDEGSSDTLGDFDSSESADTGTDDEDVGEFDAEFDLDEDEREEIEEEYGTDFQSGSEVDDAGEAGIETPDPEELAEAEAAADSESEMTGTDDSAAAETETADAGAEPPAEDVDLEDAVMDVMTELNDGSGADREAVIAEVVDAHGADRDAVEDAVQDALMGGRCYEPDDGKLTPI